MGFFKTPSEKELKRIRPLITKIENLRPQMMALSDEELRGKTEEYKKRHADGETLDGARCTWSISRYSSWAASSSIRDESPR